MFSYSPSLYFFVAMGGFVVFYVLYVLYIRRIGKRLNLSTNKVWIKPGLRVVYFALFLLAWLGPSFGQHKKEIKAIGKDILLCVDLSKSMNANDVSPTRLEKVKFELKRIISSFQTDRVGEIIFSSEAFMQCPLTYDQNALNLFIETMSSALVPAGGTDFGPPLKMALKKLEENTNAAVSNRSKIIVLISDGEDFGEETNEIVQEIKDKGIKLFAVGVGTESGGKILEADGYKTDKSGNPVVSKLNSSALKKLADETDGKYFEVNSSRNDVNKLIDTIDKLEGELQETRQVDASANQYFLFLLPAFILFLLDMLIPIKTMPL